MTILPITVGALSASPFRLDPRERATLILTQAHSDAEAHRFRIRERAGVVIQLAIYSMLVALFVHQLTTGLTGQAVRAVILLALALLAVQWRLHDNLADVAADLTEAPDTDSKEQE